MINLDQARAREMASGFRQELTELRSVPFIDRPASEKDDVRKWTQTFRRDLVEYDPDWHYFTLGELTSLTETLGPERGIFNGCTGVWLAEIYGPTVERDDITNSWRMPHADWISFEANRLDHAWLISSS